jgi:hypothetical protein
MLKGAREKTSRDLQSAYQAPQDKRRDDVRLQVRAKLAIN